MSTHARVEALQPPAQIQYNATMLLFMRRYMVLRMRRCRFHLIANTRHELMPQQQPRVYTPHMIQVALFAPAGTHMDRDSNHHANMLHVT